MTARAARWCGAADDKIAWPTDASPQHYTPVHWPLLRAAAACVETALGAGIVEALSAGL